MSTNNNNNDLQSFSSSELKGFINQLQQQLKTEEEKVLVLEHQVLNERSSLIEKVKHAEADEEYITNKLLKRLDEIKAEKSQLMSQVEQEEEYLTNTLQKRLQKVQQEKVALENQLETEEEYIVNQLQKQLEELLREKNMLQQLGEETSAYIENKKLRTELDTFKQNTDKKIQILNAQNKKLQEELKEWQTKYEDMVSSQKFELEKEDDEDDLNEDLPPRESTPEDSSRPNNIKKTAWFNVRKDNTTLLQYVILTDKEILGFQSENFELNKSKTPLTSIRLDKVSNVVVKDGGISIQDKGGNYYHLQGAESDTWCKLITSLLPV